MEDKEISSVEVNDFSKLYSHIRGSNPIVVLDSIYLCVVNSEAVCEARGSDVPPCLGNG